MEMSKSGGAAGVPGWMLALQNAVKNSVSETDITEMVQAQVKLAKEGDAKACKFVLDYLLGGANRPTQLVQNNFHVSLPRDRHEGNGATITLGDKIYSVLEALGPLTSGQIAANLAVDESAVVDELKNNTNFAAIRGGKFGLARKLAHN